MAAFTVADVLAMPLVRTAGPSVAAGAEGLGRPVRWVHSAELVDIAPLLREGDLLLSTGIAMPETGTELAAYAASLASSGAAGLVIELGRRWAELPGPLVAACDHLAMPLVALSREVRFAAVAQSVGERIVDQQVAELREAQRVHDTFTELSIAESGPDEILDTVERLAGSAVVLETEEHQVLSYRPGPWDASAILSGWLARSRSVAVGDRTSWDETQGWLVTRVGRRERGWGRLVVVTSTSPSQRLVAVAERAAAALALHRLHERQRDSAIRRAHQELLLGLLNDPASPEVQQRCELAGVPLARRQLVGMTFRPTLVSGAPGVPSTLIDEAIAAIVHAAHELRVPVLVGDIEGDVRALLSFPSSARVDATVDEFGERTLRRHALVVGAGRPVARPELADRSLREALHVVQSVADAKPGSAVHRLEDVHLRGLLAMLVDDDRVQLFVGRELDRLRQHDEQSRPGLMDAVRALVRHPNSKTDAAASLHMSRPVFYDRIAKAEQLLGVDLDEPDVRVSLHVALIADEIARGARKPGDHGAPARGRS